PLLDRLEAGVALKDLERKVDVLLEEVLIVVAEEMNASRFDCADARRRRQRARFRERVGDAGEDEEEVVRPADRKVAFEDVLVIWIERGRTARIELAAVAV